MLEDIRDRRKRIVARNSVGAPRAKSARSNMTWMGDLNVAFWSDGADKSRWIAVPTGTIAFSPIAEWQFPPGTVFVKNFDLRVDAANPGSARRLETRLLVCDSSGGLHGAVYKWRADGSEADLLPGSQTEDIVVKSANGEAHPQTWY